MYLSIGLISFVSIIALVLLILFFISRQRDQVLKRLAEMSMQKGWQFEKKPSLLVDAKGVTVRLARNSLPTGYQSEVAERLVPLGVAAVNAII